MIQNKIEKLEELAEQACAKLKLLEAENSSLKAQVKSYSDSLITLERTKAELKDNKAWRTRLRMRLARLNTRVEQALELAERQAVPQPSGESDGQ